MRVELDLFLSADKLWLPYLLFEPTKPTAKVFIWLHGMGDSAVFYSPARINVLGEALVAKGFAFFAFNNRGAHNTKTLKREGDAETLEEEGRYQAGTHYELVKDCVEDIDGAVAILKQKGFTEFYLGGHSTGANKICAYDKYASLNPFSKYVLAGAGDDTGIFFTELGAKRFWAALKYAAKAVGNGDGLRLMPKYTGMHPFSAQSAYDILNPDGDYNTFPFYEDTTERLGNKPLFEEYKSIDKPTLVIFGSQDEYAFTAGGAESALDIFMKHTGNAMLKKTDFQLILEADHGFTGYEKQFASAVGEWLNRG